MQTKYDQDMTMTDFYAEMKRVAETTETSLSRLIPLQKNTSHEATAILYDAMRYSLLGGGKRIRPYLVLLFSRMLDGDETSAIVYASALEMIHTYSLIHDDMPCIDNDDMRRGRPTCHRVYGEATALFAGDAMLTRAFEVIAAAGLPSEDVVAAVRILAKAAGADGMLGGQALDMYAETNALSLEELRALHTMKTGALIRAAVRLGCLAAHVSDENVLFACDTYALHIGLAFQIVDDILDRYGNSDELGKTVGSDESSGKTTFLSFFTKEEAIKEAERLTTHAIEAIKGLDTEGEAQDFARYLVNRTK